MSASPADVRRLPALALALAVLALVPVSEPQADQRDDYLRPLRLTPQPSEAPGAAPPGGPDATAEPATGSSIDAIVESMGGTEGGEVAAPPAGSTIVSEPVTLDTAQPGDASVVPVAGDQLERVDPASIGLLGDQDGGLGLDLWAGSRAGRIAQLLGRLPPAPRSPALRELQRRLLLSAARAPEADSADESMAFLQARVAQLRAMGELDAMVELIAQAEAAIGGLGVEVASAEPAATPTPSTPDFTGPRLDALLLMHDLAGACQVVNESFAERTEPVWVKHRIFCQTLASELDQAAFGADLLRELGHDDPAFFVLVDALTGLRDGEVETLAEPTPLHLAMLRAAGKRLPDDVQRATDPVILSTVAFSPNADMSVRLGAGERAVRAGVLPARRLGELYDGVSFTPDELGGATSEAALAGGSRGRALLYRLAKTQSVPAARAEILRELWRTARQEDRYLEAVALTLPLLREIQPAVELSWFAADAGRALYSAGLPEAAQGWLQLAVREAQRDDEHYRIMLELWPVGRLAQGEAGLLAWDLRMLGTWTDAQLEPPPAAAEAAVTDDEAAPPTDLAAARGVDRAELALALFEAVGEPLSTADWQPVLAARERMDTLPGAPRAMTDAAVWSALRRSVETGLIGESLLWILLSVDGRDLSSIHPVQAAAVVDVLAVLGFDRTARQVAVETAVTSGI